MYFCSNGGTQTCVLNFKRTLKHIVDPKRASMQITGLPRMHFSVFCLKRAPQRALLCFLAPGLIL